MAVTGFVWQLRVYILLFFTKIALRGSYRTDLRENVTVALED